MAGDDAVDLTLRLADGQRERTEDMDLARALVAELAEELLWHASRQPATPAR